jgi:transposase
MAPLPEKPGRVPSLDAALARYTEAAKAHNAVLAENERLKQRLLWFQRQMFGTRSEKLLPLSPEQQALLAILEEAEKQSPIAATPSPAEKASRRTLAPKAAPHGWGEIPSHLERVDVPEVLSVEQKTLLAEGRLVKIRDEVSERLAVRPQTLYVKRFLRGIYAKVDPDGSRTVLPLAPIESPFERGRADSSLLSFLIVSKFCDHLPLERIHKILLRQGVHLAPSTMSTWLQDLHALLLPIYRAMGRAVREGPLIHADETPCPVQLDRVAHKTHRGYLWVYGGEGHLVYEYTSTRGGEHPLRFLRGPVRVPGSSHVETPFRGTLQTDGYAGYNAACQALGLTRAGCHAHARRKFKDAEPHYPKVREYLELYASLFHLEAEWTRQGLSTPERQARRQAESRLLWAAMQAWIAAQTSTVLPKDVLGEAIGYTVGQKTALEVFLTDGAVPLSNNISERALRPVVLGRKNYLFFGSEEGAMRGAAYYSLVQSCVALQVDPREYLEDVMARLSDVPESRILELTPAGWLAAKSRPQA